MIQIAFDIPEDSLASLHKEPASLARKMRIAGAVQWLASWGLSREQAAELAGLSRPA